ncbi:hypothetical protein CG716_05530 [Mycolicibacterium sphagni]|uniref:Uncharacterized protein n=2 Tax=Mycolicibacterium sphagni TaxID=1786 RepID=A0A255DRT6_9MYCO|nr:hypothetical protein CG716_05530 [Mycolicibacterium sphagni]
MLGFFGLTHPSSANPNFVNSADSGHETKMPDYSSPSVMPFNFGATTTTQPTDEPTALATSVAVPIVTPGVVNYAVPGTHH